MLTIILDFSLDMYLQFIFKKAELNDNKICQKKLKYSFKLATAMVYHYYQIKILNEMVTVQNNIPHTHSITTRGA